MRKNLRLVALVIPMVLVASHSYAAVKVGSACSKVGSKSVSGGKSYTCVKSGKKLVWDKGVLVPVAQPSPSASASTGTPTIVAKTSFTPWATTFVTEDMTLKAIKSTSDYLGTVKPSNTYIFTVDPLITDSDKAWISKAIDYVNGAFADVLQGKVKVFLGTNHDWSAKNMRAGGEWVGDPQSPYPCSNGVNDAYCAGPNVVLLTYSDIYKANSNYIWDVGRKSTPAHEMFHNVQFALGGRNVGPDDPTHIPRWLMEGSANYFGFYVVEKLQFGTYESGRQNQVTNNKSYKTLTPLDQYDNSNSDPYGIGQAATEYLIASVGFENFLNIWKYTKSGGSFSKGFNAATGIDISDFYSKFEAARGSMKIGA